MGEGGGGEAKVPPQSMDSAYSVLTRLSGRVLNSRFGLASYALGVPVTLCPAESLPADEAGACMFGNPPAIGAVSLFRAAAKKRWLFLIRVSQVVYAVKGGRFGLACTCTYTRRGGLVCQELLLFTPLRAHRVRIC